jgi:diguanylate cyclase (GGDEF)-like protein
VIQDARSAGQPVGLLFGDIDRFKHVNDTYGHIAGDEVIRQVAGCLQKSARGNDLVARYGGEEFVVLLTPASSAGLEALAERIRSRVEQASIVTDAGEIRVTISLGGALAAADTDDPRLGESLIISADRALYEAKNRGRNGFVVTGPRNDEAAASRLRLADVG